jgi:hypothetical protein
MTHFTSRAFWKRYENLPPQIQSLASRNHLLLVGNPRHPSLQLKRVGRFWSVRIGSDHRALGVDVDDGILWIWIGPHDEYEELIRS